VQHIVKEKNPEEFDEDCKREEKKKSEMMKT
jgi:hypothetical protein